MRDPADRGRASSCRVRGQEHRRRVACDAWSANSESVGQHELHLGGADAVDLSIWRCDVALERRAGTSTCCWKSVVPRLGLVEVGQRAACRGRRPPTRARPAPADSWLADDVDLGAAVRHLVGDAGARERLRDLVRVWRGRGRSAGSCSSARSRAEEEDAVTRTAGTSTTIVIWPRGSRLRQVSLRCSGRWRGAYARRGDGGGRVQLDLDPEDLLVRIDSLVADLNCELHLEARVLDVHDDR